MEEFTEDSQLQIIVRDSGLEKTKAEIILNKFQDYFTMAGEWETKARTIIVTDEKQTDSMKMARTGRLLLRERRLEIENTRKQLKEQSLREGKAIDGIANVLKALIVPIEEHLERQEKFIEFRDAKIAEQKRIEVERVLAEQEQKRLADEVAERERVRAENAKLMAEIAKKNAELAKAKEIESKARAEAQARQDEALRIEREKAATAAKIAREKNEREMAEIRAKNEAERKESERKAAIEREAARAAAETARKREAAERMERERPAEIIRNTVECPHCHKQFNIMDVKHKEEF
jgi:hypothetical protein